MAEQIDAHRKRQQAAHPGLTLTGMYNVLEALKTGRDLTAKEKTIHTQGLVGVLKELHDELDAAVLQAYGLETGLSNDALLSHLVTLNAQRAAEEKTGKVRWLRPEFQNPAFKANSNSLLNQELLAPESIGLQADLILENDPKSLKNTKTAQQAWPNTLPLQVSAIAQLLASAGTSLSLSEIEASFKGKGSWKKACPAYWKHLKRWAGQGVRAAANGAVSKQVCHSHQIKRQAWAENSPITVAGYLSNRSPSFKKDGSLGKSGAARRGLKKPLSE